MTPMLFGMKVFVSPDVPKMTLSEDVPVTPEFRAYIDAWMLSFFGTRNLLNDGQVIVIENQSFHMNPRTYSQMKLTGVMK